jgi:FAD:protein FMN transferase
MANLVEIHNSFRAMNTDASVFLCVPLGMKKNGEKALERVQSFFHKAETTMSRFRADSELTRLNLSAGARFKASSRLFEVVEKSLEAARDTGGVFDPTILSSLMAAGYDRSFEKINELVKVATFTAAAEKCRWQDIRLDAASRSVTLPPGCGIDLGGIGKGWAVDQVCAILDPFGNYAIDAGGDIRVRGTRADCLPWSIGVADPLDNGLNLMVVELRQGAICTSTITRRKWQSAGKSRHHLIDPSSGEPAQSGVISATVMAESAVRAEVTAKTALILGPEAGLRWIESRPGVYGLLVLEDKTILYSTGFKEHAHVA